MSEFKFNLPREAATGLFALCVVGALVMHTVPALLAGLLAFVLTSGLLTVLRRWDTNRKLLSHELLAGVIVGVGSLAVLAGVSILVARFLGGETLREFMLTLAETIGQAKQYLPDAIAGYIPDSLMEMRALAAGALKEHANVVAGIGSHVLHGVLLTLIGWITGVLAAVSLSAHPEDATTSHPVFQATWRRLWAQLSESFKNVAWAQTKIAGLNALMTGLFLMLVMPLMGWNLPYAKTLILATFLCGLLPVVGNLLSNTFICILALSVAFPAAVMALVFLIVIHKLEYFLNARIQGHEIGAKAWELLIMLFAFELLFGPAGMVAAPVIYAFIKADLKRARWLA
ncbi:AI-2E family transporter [Burkholderia ubonensis]|nr:AI-2E family transporter [Burkholderia ubonensis]